MSTGAAARAAASTSELVAVCACAEPTSPAGKSAQAAAVVPRKRRRCTLTWASIRSVVIAVLQDDEETPRTVKAECQGINAGRELLYCVPDKNGSGSAERRLAGCQGDG